MTTCTYCLGYNNHSTTCVYGKPRKSFSIGGPASKPKPKSQKAKGIQVIADTYFPDSVVNTACKQATIWPYQDYQEDPVTGIQIPVQYPFFARPCPLRPRHGFVDSRLVKNSEEWDALVNAVKASDEPEAEIIRMPYLEAEWSAILTPAGISIGPGNDGATSGHGSVPVPAATQDLLGFLNINSYYAGIQDTPYVELVCKKGELVPEVVQVRDGPKVSLVDRYVPETITVRQVVRAEGDLLEWEHKATKFTSGTVVWSPGGTMSSHYAVHCVINKVPILCTPEAPEVGSTLEAGEALPELTRDDYRKIAQYIQAVHGHIQKRDAATSKWCQVAVATLHSQNLWGREDSLLRLRGASVTALITLASAACVGESRHSANHGPQRSGVEDEANLKGVPAGTARRIIYERAFTLGRIPLAEAVRAAYFDFGGDWEGGYGGKNWQRCAEVTLDLMRSTNEFLTNPCATKWNKVINHMNRVVNVAHNNGKFLNKFMDTPVFDLLATSPGIGFVNGITAGIVLPTMNLQPVDKNLARKVRKACDRPLGGLIDYEVDHIDQIQVPGKSPSFPTGIALSGQVMETPGNYHFQLKTPTKINRDYGAAFNVPKNHMTLDFQSHFSIADKYRKSYSGLSTEYVGLTMEFTQETAYFTMNGRTYTFPTKYIMLAE